MGKDSPQLLHGGIVFVVSAWCCQEPAQDALLPLDFELDRANFPALGLQLRL